MIVLNLICAISSWFACCQFCFARNAFSQFATIWNSVAGSDGRCRAWFLYVSLRFQLKPRKKQLALLARDGSCTLLHQVPHKTHSCHDFRPVPWLSSRAVRCLADLLAGLARDGLSSVFCEQNILMKKDWPASFILGGAQSKSNCLCFTCMCFTVLPSAFPVETALQSIGSFSFSLGIPLKINWID